MKAYLLQRIVEMTEQTELATEPDWVVWGLTTRSAIYLELGQIDSAIDDLDTAITVPGIPMEKLESVLRKRSWLKYSANQYAAALMDMEQIIHTPEMPRDLVLGAKLQINEIIRGASAAGVDLRSGTIQ
ncbi:MAG: hypothetical protein IMF09_08530 [Proteobacteria bacterium]|nr:hypothetical protein [Pseudomonadota bacterium]